MPRHRIRPGRSDGGLDLQTKFAYAAIGVAVVLVLIGIVVVRATKSDPPSRAAPSYESSSSSRSQRPVTPPATGDEFSGKYVGISDGDTIAVMRSGEEVRIRVPGIDCPETH